jgi:hypothetical protein
VSQPGDMSQARRSTSQAERISQTGRRMSQSGVRNQTGGYELAWRSGPPKGGGRGDERE